MASHEKTRALAAVDEIPGISRVQTTRRSSIAVAAHNEEAIIAETVARGVAVASEVAPEMLTKLIKLGVPYLDVPMRHYLHTHGLPTSANLKVIAHAFSELLRLHIRLRSWSAPVLPHVTSTGATHAQ